MARRILRLWTDGSCLPGGPGGWAFVVEQRGHVLYERSGVAAGSIQVAELMAVIEALRYAADLPDASVTQVQVCSDSRYVVDGVNDWLPAWIRSGWKAVGRRGGKSTKPIRNAARWQEVAALSERLPRLRPVRWVKGHSGAQFNSRADQLARAAAEGKSE